VIRLILVSFTLFSTISNAKIEAVIGNIPLDKNPNILALPQVDKEDEIIISRKQYLISYNKKRRSPNWVAWKLESSDIGNADRTNIFMRDFDLQIYLKEYGNGAKAVTSSEFTGTCFNRGHMVPSKDRSKNEEYNELTFLTSNIIPQTPYLNQVIWDKLEDYSRKLIQEGKKLFIISGPIYDKDLGFIGPNKDIPIPSKNFKIIFILNNDQNIDDINHKTDNIAVVMPNVLSDGSDPKESKNCNSMRESSLDNLKRSSLHNWEKYQVSISDIQNLSGIKF
jgi:endonuclease G, mitochondrial